jgi:hypothetical protein
MVRRMRWLHSMALGGILGLLATSAAMGQGTAKVSGYCLSFQLQPFTRSDPNLGTVTAYFTTSTGADEYPPLHDVAGGSWLFSSEVRPLEGQPGTYGTDYLSFSSVSGLFQYGHIVFRIPNTDSDGNGAPDFLERDRAVNLQFTGTQTVIHPTRLTVNLTGSIVRPAGEVVGDLSFNNGSPHSGKWNIPNLLGTVAYTRTNGAEMRFSLTGTRPDGATRAWTGTAVAQVGRDELSFPALGLTRQDGVRYQATSPFSMGRVGNRYAGRFVVADGLAETSWVDLSNWILEIIDTTDSDRNGIPDLTDAVVEAPRISAQPQGQSITAGDSVTFSVTAAGTPPLKYQWQKNQAPIPFATGASFSIANAQQSDSGKYRVLVSNAAGSVPSAEAILEVKPAILPPMIVSGPQSQSIEVGASATMSVVAEGTAPLKFQWQKNQANIPFATSATFTVANAQESDSGRYRVTVSNVAGSVSSSEATLEVKPRPMPPTVVSGPQSQSAMEGSPLSLTVVPGGSPPFAFQWRKNGIDIGGALADTLNFAALTPSDAGTYTVVIFNLAGQVSSQGAVLTVQPKAPPVIPPGISQHPRSTNLLVGGSLHLQAAATGSVPLLYQWWRDATAIAGATNPSLVVDPVTLGDSGAYTLLVRNAAGEIRSDAAAVLVRSVPRRPHLALLRNGSALTLQVEGEPGTRYGIETSSNLRDWLPWKEYDQTLEIAGFTIDLGAPSQRLYRVQEKSAGSSGKPSITKQPLPVSAVVGETIRFTVEATGTAPLKFQWRRNGMSISAANTATYTIVSVRATAAGLYTVVVSNDQGAVESIPAQLVVEN